ncbi:carbohydrate ABC transporter permease, partial [Kitasatospora phosalacinea]|uniref:carbohydrate ABC transporter permease n=1 Tax=Kitasatospora phosalacinea TaxID=2065 RepID=UPI0035D94D76
MAATTGPGAARPARAAAPRRRGNPLRHLPAYSFIAPFFLVFGVFGLYPLAYTGWVSLHHWDRLSGDGGFAGLDNFRELFADPDFYTATFNTFSIFLLSTAPQLALALGVAWLLDRRLRARTAWRALVLVPQYVSVAAVA